MVVRRGNREKKDNQQGLQVLSGLEITQKGAGEGCSEPTESSFRATESNRASRTLGFLCLWLATHRQTCREIMVVQVCTKYTKQ